MRTSLCLALAATLLGRLPADAQDPTASPQWETPAVPAGEVVILPEAAIQPAPRSKVVFDITKQDKPDEVAKALVRVARWLNLNAAAGVEPRELGVALVLHGDATRAALSSPAYAKHTEADINPNLEVLRSLEKHGVQLYVCGQALAHKGYATTEVVPEVAVATAALTVLIQRQQAGFAVIYD